MKTKKLSDELSIGSQLQRDDIPKLATLGFRSIICNRPDDEQANQPSFEQINETAKANNLETRYIPVAPGQLGKDDAENFDAALRDLPNPTFAYCRTGFRSEKLWSLNQSVSNIVSTPFSILKAVSDGLSRVLHQLIQK